MPSMAVCNFLVALATALVGGGIVITSVGYGIEMSMFGPGSGFWPFILGLGLLVIAALIVLDTVKRRRELSAQKVVFVSQGCFGSYRMMLLCFVYAALFPLTGFYIASGLFMIAAMYMLGLRKLPLIIGITAVFLFCLFLLFSLALHIQLPQPFFME